MKYYVLTARGCTNGPTSDYALNALDEFFKSPVEAFSDDVDLHDVAEILSDKYREDIRKVFTNNWTIEEIPHP